MLTVPRFEPKLFEKDTKIVAGHNVSVNIKDHKTDKVVCIVNYGKTDKVNMELSAKIIETIEEFIESEENDN
ncbi:MAG: hypothetical protein UHM08_08945 [Bacteroidales bacterium]|nr:hypothetical protein [Bacteroidales bacterium]